MKTILLVEDDLDVQDLLKNVLGRALAAEITVAADVQAAIAALREARFDLVVTDLNLPDGEGIEIVAAAHDLSRRVPVVLHSGASRLEPIAKACGADAYVTKSHDVAPLLAACRSLVP